MAAQFGNRGLDNPIAPDEVERFLKSVNLLTEEKKDQLENYRHYLRHHEHRRPYEWSQRDSWRIDDVSR